MVCSKDHPLAQSQRPLRWQAFAQHASVGLSDQSGIRGLLERHAAGQHTAQNIRYDVSSVAGLTSMVENNLGITAVPGLIANSMNSSKVVRRRLQPSLWRTVSLATRKGRSPSPATSALIAALLPHINAENQKTIVPLADPAELSAKGFILD